MTLANENEKMEARIRHTDTDGSASFIYFLTYYYYSAVCAQAQPCATLPALHSARATTRPAC